LIRERLKTKPSINETAIAKYQECTNPKVISKTAINRKIDLGINFSNFPTSVANKAPKPAAH